MDLPAGFDWSGSLEAKLVLADRLLVRGGRFGVSLLDLEDPAAGLGAKLLGLVLGELRAAGWIDVRPDEPSPRAWSPRDQIRLSDGATQAFQRAYDTWRVTPRYAPLIARRCRVLDRAGSAEGSAAPVPAPGLADPTRGWTTAASEEDRLMGLRHAEPSSALARGDLLGTSAWDPEPRLRAEALVRLDAALGAREAAALLPDPELEPEAAVHAWFIALSRVPERVHLSGPARAVLAWHPRAEAAHAACRVLAELGDRGSVRAVARCAETAVGMKIQDGLAALVREMGLEEELVRAWASPLERIPAAFVPFFRASRSLAAFRVLRRALSADQQTLERWAGVLYAHHSERLSVPERARALAAARLEDYADLDDAALEQLLAPIVKNLDYPRCNRTRFVELARAVGEAPDRMRRVAELLLATLSGMPWCILRERAGTALVVPRERTDRELDLALRELWAIDPDSANLLDVRGRDLEALLTLARGRDDAAAYGRELMRCVERCPADARFGQYGTRRTLVLRIQGAFSALLAFTSGIEAVIAEIESGSGLAIRTGIQCEAVYHLVKQRDVARLAQLGDRLARRAQRLAVSWLRTRGHATLAAELESRWKLAL